MDKFTRWIAAHRKFLVAVAGAALTIAIQVWGTGNPYVSLAILVATSLGVYGAPNTAPLQQPDAQQPPSGNVKITPPPAAHP